MLLSWRSPLKSARRAARSGKWAAAAASYRRHLAEAPEDAAAWVQLGHSLKEQANLGDAAAAYREAVRIDPTEEDGWIHLAYLERRLGDRDAAIAALRHAIERGGNAPRAVAALVEMGAREQLPLAVRLKTEAEQGAYARSRYAAWQASLPANRAAPAPGILAVVDARNASTDWIAATCASLDGMSCLILGPEPEADRGTTNGPVLLIEAGTRIAPDAVARLHAAIDKTGAGAAYCDHDHWLENEMGIVHQDPCFQPMFDPIWFSRAAARPPCLLVTAAAAAPFATWADLLSARTALPVTYAHVPLLLASRHADAIPAEAPQPTFRASPAEAIQIVIQTRDAPDLLEACVESLHGTAARPDLLDVVIVDNRSILPRTAALLADWARRGVARTIAHDAPFNWALANNLAAARGDAPYLLFLNNDVETKSEGWDVALREGLATEGVGALGALLLYPDGLIQHAGVVFGMGEGGPVHEGVGHSPDRGGPAGRWRHPRLASAVTGAWLATRRTLFETVGGFEERLPVSYNDIDFCLRVRAAGQGVMQASSIVAVHRESATRGTMMSPTERQRDHADWSWMRSRWCGALERDPAYNPHWLRIGEPFDGLHSPSEEEVERWIMASADPHPWAIAAPFS